METPMGILLLLIGFVSGAYGTIVGAGGGFTFVPALLNTISSFTASGSRYWFDCCTTQCNIWSLGLCPTK